MQLIVADQESKYEYQSFVQSRGIFLQDWQWGDFQSGLGKEIHRYLLRDPEIILSCQFIKQAISGKIYLFAPYGPVVSPALSQESAQRATVFFFSELKKRWPGVVFARIEPQFEINPKAFNGALKKAIDINPHKTLALDLSPSEQEILERMHPKNRYNIKISQKRGVKIGTLSSFDSEVARIFLETAKRSNIRLHSAEYYNSLLDYFKDPVANIYTKLYIAKYQESLLAAAIILYYNTETAFYMAGASADDKGNFNASHLIQWRAIADAKATGFKSYDFWGIEDDPNHAWAGLSRFKLRFGGEIKTYSGTYDYVINRAWYNAYTILRKLNRFMRK